MALLIFSFSFPSSIHSGGCVKMFIYSARSPKTLEGFLGKEMGQWLCHCFWHICRARPYSFLSPRQRQGYYWTTQSQKGQQSIKALKWCNPMSLTAADCLWKGNHIILILLGPACKWRPGGDLVLILQTDFLNRPLLRSCCIAWDIVLWLPEQLAPILRWKIEAIS